MLLIRIFILILLIACLIADAIAQDLESIKRGSEATARGVLDSTLSGNLGGNKGAELQEIIGYEKDAQIEGQGMALEQAESLGSHKRQKTHKDAGQYKCDKIECEVGHSFSTTETLKREISVEEAGFVRDENEQIKNNKGYMDKALETVKSPGDKFDFITGGYADCVSDNEVKVNKTEETCDEYYDRKEKSCFAKQVIEIDPKYTYICNKKKEIREKTCEQNLKLTCKDWEDVIIFKSPWAGRKFNKIDARSLHNLSYENGVYRFSQSRPCKHIKYDGHKIKGITGIDKLRMYALINGVHIPVKSSIIVSDPFGVASDPFVNNDIKNYLKKENNLFEVEVGNFNCVGYEFLFDYVDKATCKAWDETWEERCN